MEPQERHYHPDKLNFLFAIASLVLLTSIGLMFVNDYGREWKEYQDRFRKLEIEKTQVKYSLEQERLQQLTEYQTLKEELEKASQEYEAACGGLEQVRKDLRKLETENEIISQRFRVTKAELDAAKFEYEDVLGKGEGHLEKTKARFDELSQKVTDLQRQLEQNELARKEQEMQINDCGAGLADLERKERQMAAQLTILERKLKKIDPGSMDMTNEMASLVRDMPIIDLANPKNRIEQFVLKDITDDVNFMRVPKVDRCTTCHQGITNPDYKNAPQPFRTHPNLELYVGKNSAHPVEEFGCTVCHGGRGRGTDFISTAHTPSSEKQREEWEKKYHWHEMHHWETPMYELQHVEAGCFKCHSGETVIKGAEKLNLGLGLIERAGCYACHTIEKYKDWPKPGPDLTHLASKLTKDWTYHWIADPKSFRHSTWMPSFFGQSNNSDESSKRRSEQEIHAMTHYLFTKSTDFPLNEPPVWGDPKLGEEIVASVGCFGCHVVEPKATKVKRDRNRLLREQGPNLIGLGTKTNKAWIYHWLKNPNRYHPETKMPNLRLTDKEAADVAAYLSQDHNPAVENKPTPPVNEEILNEIVLDYLVKNLTHSQAQTKAGAMSMNDKLLFAGEKLIAHYGCYSCHNISGFENFKPIGTELTEEGSKPADKLDFGFIDIEHSKQVWFHQKLKDPRIFDNDKIKAPEEKLRMPNYDFTDEEADAIVTAILGFVKDKPASSKLPPDTPKNVYVKEGQKLIRQFNCQGCHIIEGEGGAIRPNVVEWLMAYDGRAENDAQAMVTSFAPPNLVGEGRKVHSEWLFNFLHEPVTIRPWLKTRMPTYKFNATHLNALVKYFNALDDEEFPFARHAETAMTPEEYEPGAKLFSNDYFACAKCHIVGDQMPAGSPDSWAPDFALAKTRLKPQWIDEWMKNPQDLLPGTKMPTFFDPNTFENSGPEDVLGGDEHLQIKALRNYILSLADQPPKPQPPPSAPAEDTQNQSKEPLAQ